MRKTYFGDYRFSEDLDFTAEERISIEELRALLGRTIQQMQDVFGLNLSERPPRIEIVSDDYGKESYQVRLYYRGPLRWRGDPRAIRLDISHDEYLGLPAEARDIIHPYSDLDLVTGVKIPCYSLAEMLSEKLRALSGQPFAPDARMQKILEDSAAIANASARAVSFRPRNKAVYFYPDRQWYTPFAGGSHEFMDNGELVLDDRIFFHYFATGITPAMAMSQVGMGSAYAFTAHDAQERYLDGGRTYSITLPAPIPAKNFWSFMVYSSQHRSILETDQKSGGLDSNSPDVKPNEDGSYTVWFGPQSPEGKEGNWVQTLPDKGYCVILRLHGPLEPWFDKSWKPGDLELVQ